MENREDFSRLEQFIEKLLSTINSLKEQNQELQQSLMEKGDGLEQLTQEIVALKEERVEVHQRVSKLIGTIETWEESQQMSDVPTNDPGSQLELNMSNE